MSQKCPPPLSQLVLVEANEEQRREARRLIYQDHQIWRRHRDLSQYWEADEVITEAKLAHRRAWVLVPQSDIKSLDICSACLTYRAEAFVSSPSADGAKRIVRQAAAYSIGGVFTPTKHRGHGYAGRMMSLLHETIRSFAPVGPMLGSSSSNIAEKSLSLACSVLFSDLFGYYERFGWKNKAFSDTYFLAKGAEGAPLPALSAEVGHSMSWIRQGNAEEVFSALARKDGELIVADLRRRGRDTAKTLFSLFEPTGDCWKSHRLQTLLQAKFQNRSIPSSWGVVLHERGIATQGDVADSRKLSQGEDAEPNSVAKSSSWATWWYDFRPASPEQKTPKSKLVVLRFRATSASALITIINAARRAAAEAAVDTIEVWNMDLNSSPASAEWAGPELERVRARGDLGEVWVEHRVHSRPAVAWYLDETSSTPPTPDEMLQVARDRLEWLNAERGWCIVT